MQKIPTGTYKQFLIQSVNYTMEDDLKYKNETIHLNEESYALWADRLKCEKKDLIEAIFKVGNQVSTIYYYLEMNRKLGKN